MTVTTKFIDKGADLGTKFVTKEYMMDMYPNFLPSFKTSILWLWGNNNYGQLGINSSGNDRSSPVQTIAGGTTWDVGTSGQYHTAMIKTDGTLWIWGYNGFGELGTNNITDRSSPVQTVAGGTNWRQVSVGRYFSAAVKTDYTLWAWGDNPYGQLGTNNITNYSSPVQTVATGQTWRNVHCGSFHTVATTYAGQLWMWGLNNYGQLGTNDLTWRSSPVQTVAGGTDWKFGVCTEYATAGIKGDNTLWLWGYNGYGQLGTNDITTRSSPIQTIAGGTNWKTVSLGQYHTAAIKTDGTLWTWGRNSSGQLGTNDTTPRSSPVQTVAGGTNWKQVFCGDTHVAAIKTDGTLWVWGLNVNGQLGTNDLTSRSSPVQTVAGGNNWTIVSVGTLSSITLAITEAENW